MTGGSRIERSTLTTSPGTGVTITGTVSTGSYSGQIKLIGLVYDSQERFRGTVTTISDRVDANDKWDFRASNPAIRTPTDQPDPTSYELRIDNIKN